MCCTYYDCYGRSLTIMNKTLLIITFFLVLMNCQTIHRTEISSYGIEESKHNQTYDFVYREDFDYSPLIKVFEERALKKGWNRVKSNPSVTIDLGVSTQVIDSISRLHILKVRIKEKNDLVYYGEVTLQNSDNSYIESIPVLVSSFWSNYPSKVFRLEKKVKQTEIENLYNLLSVYHNNP